MKRALWIVYKALLFIGFDYKKMRSNLGGLSFYFRDLAKLKTQKGSDTNFYFGPISPVLDERFTDSGVMSGQYFYQDLFVARKIWQDNPKHHLDIGSRTDGFVAHVAVFREIEIMDIREQTSKVNNILFKKGNLMELPTKMVHYCDSISALHSIEHFGLGRYSDPIDYDGHIKAIRNITEMLKPGGKFYFSSPIGNQRIEFNAHRIFSVKYLMNLFQDRFDLLSFSYIDDKGDFFENVEIAIAETETDYKVGCGCGIFELRKRYL